jgi:hypothetical protein
MLPGLTTREVDSRTGKLWSRWCEVVGDGEGGQSNKYTEIYIPGTEPTEVCDASSRRRFRIPGVGGLGGGR